jgi:hypothetical protein
MKQQNFNQQKFLKCIKSILANKLTLNLLINLLKVIDSILRLLSHF